MLQADTFTVVVFVTAVEYVLQARSSYVKTLDNIVPCDIFIDAELLLGCSICNQQ